MSGKLGLLLAALLVSTHAKLLGKLLSGSSGCGPSSLQLPRLNLLSMLCRPAAMSSWMTPGGYGGLGWSGMGSFNQYPGYGGSYGSSYPSYGGSYASSSGYTAYPGYSSSAGYGGYGQGYMSSPWTYSPSGSYGQQRKGREFVPKSPGQAISSIGKYNPPPQPPSKSTVNTNEVVQQQLMQSY